MKASFAAVDQIRHQMGRLIQEPAHGQADRGTQILLNLRYREIAASGGPLPSFGEVEFRNFSQNGEDGILLFLFAVLGVGDGRALELCASDGITCNVANLVVNHGWSALFVDGDDDLLERGRRFYGRCPETDRLPPQLLQAWVTRNNVNALVEGAHMSGEIDLLSLDMDGMDWWIWQALTVVQPRVVVLEYNNRWSAEQSVTVPYREDFVARDQTPTGEGWFGASLPAFVALGRKKGYRLVGSNRIDTNAFFLREDLGRNWFPEVPASACLQSSYARHQHETKYPSIADLVAVNV